MVVRVVQRTIASRHDPARAPVPRARRLHGVFAVPAALALREHPLAIREGYAVARIGKGTALLDQGEGFERLFGEIFFFNVPGETENAERKSQKKPECQPHCVGGFLSRMCSS